VALFRGQSRGDSGEEKIGERREEETMEVRKREMREDWV
jgi:hypothetical protein